MAYNKVVYNGNTLVDLTGDTVAPSTLALGVTAHNAAGEDITGNMLTHAVGEIVPVIGCASGYVPEGCVPCDGAEYSRSQFTTLYDSYLTGSSAKLVTCTYAEYASDIATYGQCDKWAVNTSTQKFKVPTISQNQIVNGVGGNAPVFGNGYVTSVYDGIRLYGSGSWDARFNFRDQCLGATTGSSVTTDGNQPANNKGLGTPTKAQLGDHPEYSGLIADLSEATSIKKFSVKYFVCVAGGSINQSMMDWSAWASGLAGKLNADFTNKPNNIHYVVETYVNGTSGYRIWSDGYCEQWGKAAWSTTGVRIDLLKAFINTDYCVLAIKNNTTAATSWGPGEGPVAVTNQTTSSFFVNTGVDYGSNNFYASWKASGYLAAGQY